MERNKVHLGDVCKVVSGSTPKTGIPEYWNGDIKWILCGILRYWEKKKQDCLICQRVQLSFHPGHQLGKLQLLGARCAVTRGSRISFVLIKFSMSTSIIS